MSAMLSSVLSSVLSSALRAVLFVLPPSSVPAALREALAIILSCAVSAVLPAVLPALMPVSVSISKADALAFLAGAKDVILGVVEVVVAMITLLGKVNEAVVVVKELADNAGETLAAIQRIFRGQWTESPARQWLAQSFPTALPSPQYYLMEELVDKG
ncbi:hypothetical protein PCG10_010671 [Penicillium crustosum]|uniref:Uncharacterized protein n=1 Tax=Penicillium crustosum TaxID=36656 RepID=A0A9P5GEH3_PENCR|nr:hypothetical protein PCG10_010671 [Penicillium crustosum]